MDINRVPRVRAKNFAVIGDTHLGDPRSDLKRVRDIVQRLHDYGYRIIFNGDIWDALVHDNAFEDYELEIGADDIVLLGNHDFDLESEASFSRFFHVFVESGERAFFITHGDHLDFWAAFLLMAERKAQFPLALLQKLKHFRLEDVFWFYRDLIRAPGNLIAFFSRSKRSDVKSMLILASIVITHAVVPIEKAAPDLLGLYPYDIKAPRNPSILAVDPFSIAERYAEMWPSLRADACIFGHLHRTMMFTSNGMRFLGHGSIIANDERDKTFLTVDEGEETFVTWYDV